MTEFAENKNLKHKVLKRNVTAERRRRVTSGDADEAQSTRAHYGHHPKQSRWNTLKQDLLRKDAKNGIDGGQITDIHTHSTVDNLSKYGKGRMPNNGIVNALYELQQTADSLYGHYALLEC